MAHVVTGSSRSHFAWRTTTSTRTTTSVLHVNLSRPSLSAAAPPHLALLLLLLVAAAGCLHASADLFLRPERVLPAQFRIRCNYSHSLKDDPIVYPNKPGASHLHDFLGSKLVNAFTTDPKALVGKATTCGLKADAAAYWVPSLFQRVRFLKNGTAQYKQLKPFWTLFYYRTATSRPETIKTIPAGLKMITGDPKTGLKHVKYANVEWWCGALGTHYNTFPDEACVDGNPLIAKINFPTCWDGKNLDSPDHKSHVKHIPLNTTCPPTHPVPIPRISIKVYYPIQQGLKLTWPKDGMNGNPPVYLSTAHSGGTGSSFEYHSDFMNGWDQKVLDSLVTNCINKNKKCLVQEDN